MIRILLIVDANAFLRIGGLPLWSRLARTLRQLGDAPIHVVLGDGLRRRMPTVEIENPRDRIDAVTIIDDGSRVTAATVLATLPVTTTTALIVPADRLIDPRILKRIEELRPPVVAIDSRADGIAPRCGPVLVDRSWLDSHPGDFDEQVERGLEQNSLPTLDIDRMPTYASHLRRDLRPFCLPAPTAQGWRTATRALLDSTQKGALDLPAIAHAPIEKTVAWWLADSSITPNQITVATNIVAWSATYLLFSGHLAWGLALALLVGVLDGVDGKLARLRLETSRLGELEHWADFFYEWSWWAALAYHLSASGQLATAWRSFVLLALVEIADGGAKLLNLRTFGRTIDEMGAFDRALRLVGGRRNVYVWLLTLGTVLGKTASTFTLLPWLQGATAVIHWLRIGWLLRDRRRYATPTTTGEPAS